MSEKDTMKAVVLKGITPLEDVKLDELPIPAVKPGWALVLMKGRGLNHSERVLRIEEIAEDYIKKPVIPGIEGVGIVVDPSDTGLVAGQPVCALMGGMGRGWDGSYAEYCLVRADHLFALPEEATDLSWATLAAIPETFFTAWGSLFECLRLKASDTLLVRGASSGLGYASIQIAHALGCHVIATTHREKYVGLLRQQGADEVIVDPAGSLMGSGVHADKVLELIGPKTLTDSLALLDTGGICCDTGILGGVELLDGFDPITAVPNGCYLTGFYSNYPTQEVMGDIYRFVAEYHIKPLVAQTFDFSHIVDAIALQDAGGFQGKIVVADDGIAKAGA